MEFVSSAQHDLVVCILAQIDSAITEIFMWNKDIRDESDYISSSDGNRNLAATSMLLSAIGEGLKKVDKLTNGEFLPLRPEIPWKLVMGMRDHITHGYFDIDATMIFTTVREELQPLQSAIHALKAMLETK